MEALLGFFNNNEKQFALLEPHCSLEGFLYRDLHMWLRKNTSQSNSQQEDNICMFDSEMVYKKIKLGLGWRAVFKTCYYILQSYPIPFLAVLCQYDNNYSISFSCKMDHFLCNECKYGSFNISQRNVVIWTC